ncbi:MAG: zf-HC2 domain-containing protein [bacterium]
MTHSCEQIEHLITGLIDNELTDQDQQKAKLHLKECTSCTDVYEVQNLAKQQLHNRYLPEKAPFHLRARIRRDIANIQSWPGFFESLAKVFATYKLKGALATVALALFIAVPYGQYFFQNTGAATNGKMQYVSLEGQALCVDCEVIKAAKHNPNHTDDHNLGLRDRSGRIWNIINASEGKKLVHEFSLVNKSIKIEGYALPGAFNNNIDVRSFTEL